MEDVADDHVAIVLAGLGRLVPRAERITSTALAKAGDAIAERTGIGRVWRSWER